MQTAKTDKTGRMPRLIWVFAGHTLILLVLSCRGSFFKSIPLYRIFTVQSLYSNQMSRDMTKPT